MGFPAAVLAAESGSGTVEGNVVNKTQDGSAVSGLEVTLKTYTKNDELSSAVAKTDSEGHFVFTGLLTDPAYTYILMLPFQQVVYYSQDFTFEEKETTKSVPIEVYDSTNINASIKVETAHAVISASKDSLTVMEFWQFVNESDRAYIGPQKGTAEQNGEILKFSLPEGATNVQYSEGLVEYSAGEKKVDLIDTTPVLPGEKQIIYSYVINNSSGKYTFSRDVTYPIAKYNLLVNGENIEISATQLKKGEPFNMGGTLFTRLSGTNFAPGDRITAELSGPSKPITQNTILLIAIVLVVILIVFTLVYTTRKRTLQLATPDDNSIQTRQRMLSQLARLDDDFENQQISEENYLMERAAIKEKLMRVMKRPSKRGPPK